MRSIVLGFCAGTDASNLNRGSNFFTRDVQIIQRWKIKKYFRNICVHTQNISMSLSTCSHAQIIKRWKANIMRMCAENIHVSGYLLETALEGQTHF